MKVVGWMSEQKGHTYSELITVAILILHTWIFPHTPIHLYICESMAKYICTKNDRRRRGSEVQDMLHLIAHENKSKLLDL